MGNQWSAKHDHRRFSRSLKRRSTWKHRPINDELLLTDNSSKLVNKIKRRISKKRTIFLRFSMLNGILAVQLIWAKLFADRFYITPGWMSFTYGVVEHTVHCGTKRYKQVYYLIFQLLKFIHTVQRRIASEFFFSVKGLLKFTRILQK